MSKVIKNHFFHLPLDYSNPKSEKIQIFIREISRKEHNKLPYLLYLQGGPGYESPRPISSLKWIDYASKFYNILLLDQRGTGKSTQLNIHDFSHEENNVAVEKIALYRADNIVRDAEEIRKSLIGNKKWSILGQSFGGFCCVHYLSYYQDSLEKVFITGGLPPLSAHPDDIYRKTYKRVFEKNLLFYKNFPKAQKNAIKIARYLQKKETFLPNGDSLTVKRFQQLGLQLGFSDGPSKLNYLFEDAFVKDELSYTFLKNIFSEQSFDTNPLFTILHEACYAQKFSTNWSAQRIRKEFQQFNDDHDNFYFTGEMLFPWMMDEYKNLKPFKNIALGLAEKNDWSILYDKKILNNNIVPVAAAVYTNDMYVDRDYSIRTASEIKGLKIWETNKLEHNGLRSDGMKVLKKLFKLLN